MINISSLLLSVVAARALGMSLDVKQGTGCCFHLNAQRGPGGPVGQLDDGQNRIGQTGLRPGKYCLDTNGGLTDDNGRGCILTPPTTQWQCDAGAKPTVGFSVTAAGILVYGQTDVWWSCPTGDHGGYNIYTTPLKGEPGCVPITLTADNCKGTSPSIPTPPAPTKQCPMNLPQHFEFPHLIVPLNASAPNVSYGTSYNGTVGGHIVSVFNFDIPPTMSGKQCQAVFSLPTQAQLETSAFSISGIMAFQFAMLTTAAKIDWTFASLSTAGYKWVSQYMTLKAGTAVKIAQFPCPAGQAMGIVMSAGGNSELSYFQDYNPCPIGLYVFAA